MREHSRGLPSPGLGVQLATQAIVLGLLWLHYMQGRACALQARPREDWLASEEEEQ